MSLFFTSIWGLWGLAGIAAIIAIHMFVRRAPTRQVSSLALWAGLGEMRFEGKHRRPPPPSLILLLEVLALLCLVAALCGPMWRGSQERNLAIIVDTSASMAAHVQGDTIANRFAKDTLDLAPFAGSVSVTLVESGPYPQSHGLPSLEAASKAIAQIPYLRGPHSLAPAYNLLQGLGFKSEDIVVFSDRTQIPEIPGDALVIRKSAPVANIAIVGAGWPEAGDPFAVLQNFGDQAQKVVVTCQAKESEESTLATWRVNITLPPQGQQILPVTIPSPHEKAPMVHLEMHSEDPSTNALSMDDSAILHRPAPSSLGILALGAHLRGPFRQLAQASRHYAWVPVADSDIIATGENAATEVSPKTTLLHFPKTTADTPTRLAKNPSADTFSPLMDGFELQGLVWYHREMDVPHKAQVLLAAASTPLLWQAADGYHFNIDVQRSNFFRHPSFPIFMQNLADLKTRQAQGLQARSLTTESQTWFGKGACAGTLTGPNGFEMRTLPSVSKVFLNTLVAPGLYRWHCGEEDMLFSLHFASPEESNLLGQSQQEGRLSMASLFGTRHENLATPIAGVFAALALLFLFAAWWLVQRQAA